MKIYQKSILVILFGMFCSVQANAQYAINGKVTDESQEVLPGANIKVKGTSSGTATNREGVFQLNVMSLSDTLIISYLGFQTQEIPINGRTSINIIMSASSIAGEEVVVVGYGSQRKKDLTGAVGIVEMEELAKSLSTNVTDRLQGRIPGVTVSKTGEPGSLGDITIRGVSFFGDNNPLFVIDGIPTEDSPNINPTDIESIQILKDASSSAIYGSRAANGVVVITTKKGNADKMSVSFESQAGIQQFSKKLGVVNAAAFARIHNAAYDNAGLPRRNWSDDLSRGVDTDWQKAVFDAAASFRNNNISVSSGSEKSKVYLNLNNTDQNGTINKTRFKRVGVRLNTEFDLNDKIKVGQNLAVSKTRQIGQQYLDGQGVIYNTLMMFPTIPVYDPTTISGYGHGSIEDAETYQFNPVGVREMYNSYQDYTKIIGNIFTDIQLLKNLEYKFNFGADIDMGAARNFQRGGQIRTEIPHLSGLEENSAEDLMLVIENRLTYSKSINDHQLSVMATHTEQQFDFKQNGISINGGFDSDDPFFQISSTTASPENISTYGNQQTSTIRSFLGRFTYNFSDKYLITANVRRDGSSKFPEKNRWGTFPSVSAGWIINEEGFFNIPIISRLKLRAGYGVVGNASIGNYAYQTLIASSSAGGTNYNLGYGDRSVIGAARENLVNDDLKWETLKETNLGLDLVMFDGKFELTGDYYFGNLEDLLVAAPVPGTTGEGIGGTTIVNVASMERSGWELLVVYREIEKSIKYDITANLFHTENKVTSLPLGNLFGEYSITTVGLPIGQIYTLGYQGIYKEAAELNEYTVINRIPYIGDAKYQDANGDGNISAGDDRVIVGDPNPDLQYGLNLNTYWKNFELSVFFQGVHGVDVFNGVRYDMDTSPLTTYSGEYDPYIDGSGTDPRPTADFGSPNNIASSLYVEDGSYLRLKNVRLGYKVPWNNIGELTLFAVGQNLLTFTGYSGMDPEFESGILAPGVDDGGGFPNVRIYNLGLNFSF